MNGASPLALTLPATEQTQHFLLDTDNRKLSSEIEHLPYADIPSALNLAYHRIHTLNRFSLPAAKRSQNAVPFHHAFVRFREYYRHKVCGRFQFKTTDYKELDLLLDFIQELIFAYKHVIQEAFDRGRQPSGFAIIIYTAMLYSHFYNLFSYNRGRLLGPGHWQEFHSLFNLACELELQEIKLNDLDKATTSIEELYKKSVLLGISSPYSMSAEDHWNTLDYLQRFAHRTDIYPLPEAHVLLETYSVSPLCTAAATIPGIQECPHPATNILDCGALLNGLLKQIQSLKLGQGARTVGLKQLSRGQAEQLLSNLLNSWSRSSARVDERHLSNEAIGLVWGLDTICAMLDPNHRKRGSASEKSSAEDKRAWSVANDESASGFCVRINKNSLEFPHSGQVVALIRQLQGRKFLEMGMVKWSAIGRDDTPRCGIQRLHGNARKIRVHCGDEMDTQRDGLLILHKEKGKTADKKLIVPTGTLKNQDRAKIQGTDQNSRSEMRVDQLLLTTRSVDVFRVEVYES